MSATPLTTRPTHARLWVIFFGMTLAILSYIDRVCISQAAPLIARDLGFDKIQMGWIFSAFLIAYGVFEIPGAWFGDWVGARKGLIRIVLGWSAFTAITGAMWSFTSMFVARFLFGVGEAGCFPLIAKSFTTWLPAEERTRAQGFLWTAARWGGAFTPLLVVWFLKFVTWRAAFVVFGSIGLIWCFFFARWYKDNPADHKGVNAGELEILKDVQKHASDHAHVPWGKLFTTPSVLLLALQYFFLSFGWYFYLTWMPTYLQEFHKLTLAESARYATVPLLFNGFGSLFCGLVSPYVTRWTGSIVLTRKSMACIGFLGAGGFLMAATRMPDVNSTISMIAAACFFNDWVMPHAWASCMDVGGKYASTVAGTMNLMGNLAGSISSTVGGYLLQSSGGDWTTFITILASVYFGGLFVWPFIKPTTPFAEARQVS